MPARRSSASRHPDQPMFLTCVSSSRPRSSTVLTTWSRACEHSWPCGGPPVGQEDWERLGVSRATERIHLIRTVEGYSCNAHPGEALRLQAPDHRGRRVLQQVTRRRAHDAPAGGRAHSSSSRRRARPSRSRGVLGRRGLRVVERARRAVTIPVFGLLPAADQRACAASRTCSPVSEVPEHPQHWLVSRSRSAATGSARRWSTSFTPSWTGAQASSTPSGRPHSRAHGVTPDLVPASHPSRITERIHPPRGRVRASRPRAPHVLQGSHYVRCPRAVPHRHDLAYPRIGRGPLKLKRPQKPVGLAVSPRPSC